MNEVIAAITTMKAAQKAMLNMKREASDERAQLIDEIGVQIMEAMDRVRIRYLDAFDAEMEEVYRRSECEKAASRSAASGAAVSPSLS